MRMQKRIFFVGLILAFVGCGWVFAADDSSVPAPSSSDAPLFTFMQISDAHVGHKLNKPVHKRLAAAVELANAIQPAFVISSGDLTTHPVYGADEANLAQFGEYKECMKPLKMPLYNLPGNHDIGYFDAEKSPHPSGRPWGDYKKLVEAYCREIGPLDQSFEFQNVGFILLNNNPAASHEPGHVSERQLEWLERELKQFKRSFLFCHVPLLEKGTGEPWGESGERIIALCKQYEVAAAVFGHQHNAYVKELDGVQYIMCPDLKDKGHQAVYQYRVFSDRFEFWKYDVFSKEGSKVGCYASPQGESRRARPARGGLFTWHSENMAAVLVGQ